MNTNPKRGEVWMVGLEPTVGQEINSHGFTRPCIVISSDSLRARQLRTVVPVTGWQAKFTLDPLQVFLAMGAGNGLSKDSAADTTQMRTVALERFDYRKGVVTADELLEIVLGIGMVIEHP